MNAPTPTGPIITKAENLRRTVTEAQTKEDGTPSSAAFSRSSHDSMLSTIRGDVDGVEAASRWEGKSPAKAIWPVEVEYATSLGAPVYADGGRPCGCDDPGCADAYPEDHASVDMRPLTRGQATRLAKQLQARAIALGPVHLQ